MSDFWSKRRAAVAVEERAAETAREAEEQRAQEAEIAERADKEILEELGLPDPEEMDRPEQVQELLKAAVPQRLKSRALRRLWRLNPVLANVDGLVDYGEDFTDAATVVENLQTAYQVGKGMLKTLVEEEIGEEAANVPETPAAETPTGEAPAAQPPGAAPDPAPDAAALAELSIDPDTAPAGASVSSEDIAETAPRPATPRRMRFSFDTAN